MLMSLGAYYRVWTIYLNICKAVTITGNLTNYEQVSTCTLWMSNAGHISMVWAIMF